MPVMCSNLINVQVLDVSAEVLIDSGACSSLCTLEFRKEVFSIVSYPIINSVQNFIVVDYSGTRKRNFREEVSLPIKIAHMELY